MEMEWRYNGDGLEIEWKWIEDQWRWNGDRMEMDWRPNGDVMERD